MKTGQKVWSCIYGYGEIVNICSASNYPVSVLYQTNKRLESYTIEGKWLKEARKPEIYIQEEK